MTSTYPVHLKAGDLEYGQEDDVSRVLPEILPKIV